MLLTLISAIGALHTIALFIVNVTPTPKDNLWLKRIDDWVTTAAGIITTKAKERLAK